MSIGLLLPKGWIGFLMVFAGGSALAVDLHFSDTITIGSIIVAALVIVLSGLFTLRNNLRSFWHDLAEERLAEIQSLHAHLAEREQEIERDREAARETLEKQTEEQRLIRHELKNEVAALHATLRVEQAKTDLSALMKQLGDQHIEAMTQVTLGLEKQQEIIDMLANGGTINERKRQ